MRPIARISSSTGPRCPTRSWRTRSIRGRRAHWLRHAMDMLSERERLIIEARRLHDDDLVTLETVGRRLGISKERVRQIENRALDKLKKALQSNRSDMLAAA